MFSIDYFCNCEFKYYNNTSINYTCAECIHRCYQTLVNSVCCIPIWACGYYNTDPYIFTLESFNKLEDRYILCPLAFLICKYSLCRCCYNINDDDHNSLHGAAISGDYTYFYCIQCCCISIDVNKMNKNQDGTLLYLTYTDVHDVYDSNSTVNDELASSTARLNKVVISHKGRSKIREYLLLCGADPTIRNKYNQVPSDIAKKVDIYYDNDYIQREIFKNLLDKEATCKGIPSDLYALYQDLLLTSAIEEVKAIKISLKTTINQQLQRDHTNIKWDDSIDLQRAAKNRDELEEYHKKYRIHLYVPDKFKLLTLIQKHSYFRGTIATYMLELLDTDNYVLLEQVKVFQNEYLQWSDPTYIEASAPLHVHHTTDDCTAATTNNDDDIILSTTNPDYNEVNEVVNTTTSHPRNNTTINPSILIVNQNTRDEIESYRTYDNEMMVPTMQERIYSNINTDCREEHIQHPTVTTAIAYLVDHNNIEFNYEHNNPIEQRAFINDQFVMERKLSQNT